jgi:hypothetical protein
MPSDKTLGLYYVLNSISHTLRSMVKKVLWRLEEIGMEFVFYTCAQLMQLKKFHANIIYHEDSVQNNGRQNIYMEIRC